MVVICNETFSNDNEEQYKKYFETFNFPLSDFQKYSIKATVDEKHSLITAHTGSGKTLPAEFAIQYFTSQGKKVIYTSPIKALSNQKLHDLSEKYPEISFGLLTGDTKHNSEADVLIMTTEILRNTLFQRQINKDNENAESLLHFTMDIENELACVIFDEIHYIDDSERGSVWEQSIIMLPKNVQMIMLSATIDNPELFARWIEKKKEKEVVLSGTNKRVVPLNHYGYITTQQKYIDDIKNQKDKKMVQDVVNKFILLKEQGCDIDETNYHKIKKVERYFENNKSWVPRKNVLNALAGDLKEKDMLPAICFVFSRRNVEICAKEIDIQLHEDGSTVPSIIENECRQLLVKKLSNWREYIRLPEYNTIVKLLEKGIAIHHAGILPIFREMIEMMFEKKYIKMLFATETFAVGINMPTKTVLFSGLTKFNGSTMRFLESHEYTQMAGRAGRRGIDKRGYVIHCNNLFDYPSLQEYRNMLSGSPKRIKSRFKISYNLILNIMHNEPDKLVEFIEKSLMQEDIESQIKNTSQEMAIVDERLFSLNKGLSMLSTPLEILEQYNKLTTTIQQYGNKDRKKKIKEMKQIEEMYPKVKQDVGFLKERDEYNEKYLEHKKFKSYAEGYVKDSVELVMSILKQENFVDEKDKITEKGICATYMQEIHGLVFSDLYISTEGFKNFTAKEIVGLLSCFTDIRIKEEERRKIYVSQEQNNKYYEELINKVKPTMEKYEDLEIKRKINTGTNYYCHYDLVNYMIEWCESDSELIAKTILTRLKYDENIFIGDFIKAILKINNIVKEIEKVSILLNNIELSNKLQDIPSLTLKHVVTKQSLYL
jgi:superfamily II RNA helicase